MNDLRVRYPIKLVYDIEEDEYVVFVEALNLEGRGKTEKEAVENLVEKYDMIVERI